jgi:hypothetical protein
MTCQYYGARRRNEFFTRHEKKELTLREVPGNERFAMQTGYKPGAVDGLLLKGLI